MSAPLTGHFDKCVKSFATQSSVGALVGVTAAAIFFKGTAARAATAAFGTGVGTGSSYRDCDYMLQEYQGRILAATRGEKKEKEATE